MLTTYAQRERREGIVPKTISFPVPPLDGRPLPAVARSPRARDHPLRHITNPPARFFRSQDLPMARARNIATIVDGARRQSSCLSSPT